MPHSTHSFNACAACRLEWRPSRWVIAMLLALGALGGCSLLASDLAPLAAWPCAALALACGLWLARHEARKPRRQLLWLGGEGPVSLDGQVLPAAELHWRGPLAFLRWRGEDGRLRHLSWWPDTLPAAARRELRLVAGVAGAAPDRPSVAG